MKELTYPIDASFILKKKAAIKRRLLTAAKDFTAKKIAVLGGSTTHDVCACLELFLLDQGIKPSFYQSDYGRYYEDAIFGSEALGAFRPDIIYIHTTNRNISWYPSLADTAQTIEAQLAAETEKFTAMWDKLSADYACPIIQNNFEYPCYRLLGNQDASNIHGQVNYITRLNMQLYAYAQTHANFFVHDLNYLAADFGLASWADPFYWYLYKYALSLQAIPHLAYSLSHIIQSIFGKNKKALVLDLDGTLWGGVVGDDGVAGIALGPETPIGQAHLAFQLYLKAQRQLGVVLCVVSKNDAENALAGLRHPHAQITPDDLIALKANWAPKNQNMAELMQETALSEGSFVFVDDNPAERELVRQSFCAVAVPELTTVDAYIKTIDRAGYFEPTVLSADDANRTQMYQSNAKRQCLQQTFVDYTDYLQSLAMQASILPFAPLCMPRIAQLTNKSNQFNLTTRRFTTQELQQIAADAAHLTLYGTLADRFGENGVVTVLAGHIEGAALHLDLWVMSCRVLKRGMEHAMLDALVAACLAKGISQIVGYYYKTEKNKMVADFYPQQGFALLAQQGSDSVWSLAIGAGYQPKNKLIAVNGGQIEGA